MEERKSVNMERKNRDNLEKQTNKQNRTLKNVELYQKISHTCTWSPTEDKTEN